MTTEKLTGMTVSNLRILARSMGYADVVLVHCSDRIARQFEKLSTEEARRLTQETK